MELVLPAYRAAARGQHLGVGRSGDPSCGALPRLAHMQVWRECRASCRALGTQISVLGKAFILE